MKIKDGICGLIVGDALGVPVEFKKRSELEKNPVTSMVGYGTYNMPPGTWSDDSSMTIATMQSIVQSNCIDYSDIMEEFCLWINNGKYTQYEYTFDYGRTTKKGIDNYITGEDPIHCGGTGDHDNGNGSLMRILPLAYLPNITTEEIENVSALTHGHLRSKIACVLYIEIAKSMLEGKMTIDEHIAAGCEKIKEYYEGNEELNHFSRILNNEEITSPRSGGYVMDSIESSLYCLKKSNDYRSAVLKAVNLGHDTDTTAAICGGLAGIYYGYDSIPEEWIETIPEIDKVLELCDDFENYIYLY